MRILQGFSYVLALLVVYGTVCPWIPSDAWWVRTMDFPRVQIGALALLALACLGVVLSRARRRLDIAVSLVLLAAFSIQAARIVPFTPFVRPTVPSIARSDARPDAALRVLVANVQFDNEDPGPFLRQVQRQDPDVVLAIETDAAWLRRLAPLETSHPHGLREARPDGLGMALYSRLPVRAAEVHHLVRADRPSITALLVLRSGRSVRFWGLHPAPPGLEKPNGERRSSRSRDVELLRLANHLARPDAGVPTIVAGDFNDAAWSPTTRRFKRVSGLRDPRVGRGLFNTYHAEWWPLRYPIDHIFVSSSFRLLELRRLDSIGSDHFPMLIDVALDETKVSHAHAR